MENLKTKVTAVLIKRGNNPEEVKKMIAQEFDFVVNAYVNATPGKIAEVIRCLY